MSHYKYAPAADANHSEVIGWYEELYCSVVDLHTLGFGCPDLLVGVSGLDELVEVKTDTGQLEPSQLRFNRDWRGRKPALVRNHADVINHVANMRARAGFKWGNNGKRI